MVNRDVEIQDKFPTKVYCEGCKYMSVSRALCRNKKNSSFVFIPIGIKEIWAYVTKVNKNNDCKLREDENEEIFIPPTKLPWWKRFMKALSELYPTGPR